MNYGMIPDFESIKVSGYRNSIITVGFNVNPSNALPFE